MCQVDIVKKIDSGGEFSDPELWEIITNYGRMWEQEDVCVEELTCGRYKRMASYIRCCDRWFCIDWLKALDGSADIYLGQPYECVVVTKQFYMPMGDEDSDKVREKKK